MLVVMMGSWCLQTHLNIQYHCHFIYNAIKDIMFNFIYGLNIQVFHIFLIWTFRYVRNVIIF